MRPHHTAHNLPAFPVYSCTFLSPNTFVVGGGGGASRSGIKNKLRLYAIDENRGIELKDEFELERGEDAPMSMAGNSEQKTIICGVNSTLEKLEQGDNQNCRVYSVDDKIRLLGTKSTLSQGDINNYQKVTIVSPSGHLLGTAGSHEFCLLKFPSLESVTDSVNTDKEIYDASFSSSNTVALATTQNVFIYDLPAAYSSSNTISTGSSPKRRKKQKTKANGLNSTSGVLKLRQTLDIPSLTGDVATFRSTRFHPTDDSVLYATINVTIRSTTSRTPSRHAYVVKWNTENWTVDKVRKVGDYGATSFDISPDGRFLAIGSSDLSIRVFDSRTTGPLISILKAFEFPPTFVKFNPTTSLLLSGSADNMIRIVSIPNDIPDPSQRYLFSILALVILIFAIAISLYVFKQ